MKSGLDAMPLFLLDDLLIKKSHLTKVVFWSFHHSIKNWSFAKSPSFFVFVSPARENLREFLFHKIRTLELTNIEFHEHVEVVDLSTCSIDLQPENLPTKRIWSKKYPIRIRPNTRKPYSTQEATKKMAAKKDIKDEAELDLDKEPEDDEVSYEITAK